jgi:hypothetical protein
MYLGCGRLLLHRVPDVPGLLTGHVHRAPHGGWPAACRVALVAAAALTLGIGTLGTRWRGVEVAPGLGEDTVTLVHWARCWAALAVLAVAAAHQLRGWSHRVMTMVPLLSWLAWSLRQGTLGPLAFVIYAVPTLGLWVGALQLTDRWWLARTVKRQAP